MAASQIKVGDIVTFTFEVKEIHEGYETVKISDATWIMMKHVQKLSDAEAMLWKLENQ